MAKVLHIGPCDSPGGMGNVMRILADHPPEGWQAQLLASHVEGSSWAKWRAYRRARATLVHMLNDSEQRPDVVHLHTAADWSWWRKRRFALLAHKAGCRTVVHIHSGKFDRWLGPPNSQRCKSVQSILKLEHTCAVSLGEAWKSKLEPLIGASHSINNPVDPEIKHRKLVRHEHHLLLLGRNDPVKGHDFACQVAITLRKKYPHLRLTMTGCDFSERSWIEARGWVDEGEKQTLLDTASVLLLPSGYEGQPMVILEAFASGLQVCMNAEIEISLSSVVRAKHDDLDSWVTTLSTMLDNPIEADSLVKEVEPFRCSAVTEQWKLLYESQ